MRQRIIIGFLALKETPTRSARIRRAFKKRVNAKDRRAGMKLCTN